MLSQMEFSLWPQKTDPSACFFGGSRALRAFFETVGGSLCLLLWLLILPVLAAQEPQGKKEGLVILVTIDGLRAPEVLGGLDRTLCNKEIGGVKHPGKLRDRYDAKTRAERRRRLMPFLWNTLVPKGQLFGDESKGSPSRLVNKRCFSYPGYAELLQGFVDPWADSNRKRWNPNKTVLEWLGRLPAFRNRVVGVGSWDVLSYIVNTKRSGLPINSGAIPLGPTIQRMTGRAPSVSMRMIDKLQAQLVKMNGTKERPDSFTFAGALEILKKGNPRLLWLGLGETDVWGHRRRYDLYLKQIQNSDAYLRRIWEFCQKDPRYKGRSTLIVTCDHGRGSGKQWVSHSARIPGSAKVWMGLLGAGVPALGVRQKKPTTLSQVAPTIAWLLGYELKAFEPRAAKPLPLWK